MRSNTTIASSATALACSDSPAVVSLVDAEGIDAAGLGELVGGQRRANNAGGCLQLVTAHIGVQSMLSVTGFDLPAAAATVGRSSSSAKDDAVPGA